MRIKIFVVFNKNYSNQDVAIWIFILSIGLALNLHIC